MTPSLCRGGSLVSIYAYVVAQYAVLEATALSVRDLGIYLDRNASIRTRVSKTVSNCFAALRQIRSIRQ